MEPVVGIVEHRAPRRVWLLFGLGAAAVVGVPLVATNVIGQPEGATHSFEIPPGTSARLAAGESVQVLPADLRFKVRDRLVVFNRDSATHYVGAFPIGPGQTLSKRFSDAVSLSGYCSLHPSGNISIEVGTAR